MEIQRDFQSVFTSIVDMFAIFRDVQSAMGRDRNRMQLCRYSVAHGQPPFLGSEN